MRVFVATSQGQGDHDNDFFHGVDGELVRMPFDSCCDPQCGCDRSVSGLASSKASTTFMSVDRPDLDSETYRSLFRDALEDQGWVASGEESNEIDDLIAWHIDAAAGYPKDTVMRVRVEQGSPR